MEKKTTTEGKIGIKIVQIKEGHFLFTSESVTPGHPDKLSDYISDSILDACLKQDPDSKVACESACKSNIFMVFGEISTKAKISFEQVVRNAIEEVGYDQLEKGACAETATVIVNIEKQSPEITDKVVSDKPEDFGAGDQGLMMGYASNETESFMPLSHHLALRLSEKLTQVRVDKIVDWLRPDGKTQVTVEYKMEGKTIKPIRVHTVLISAQHKPGIDHTKIYNDLLQFVVKQVIPDKYLDDKTIYHLNPKGEFTIGGPTGDAGLTGRKIIVDSYGGWGGHGGGAFSGKDSTKVDRSGAYAARWIAKSLVANKFCERCLVQVSYAIGLPEPLSVHIDTYGTVVDGFTDYSLREIVFKNFDLRPGKIINELKLKEPIFKKLSAFGHFGRDDPDFLWEKVKDLSMEMKK